MQVNFLTKVVHCSYVTKALCSFNSHLYVEYVARSFVYSIFIVIVIDCNGGCRAACILYCCNRV